MPAAHQNPRTYNDISRQILCFSDKPTDELETPSAIHPIEPSSLSPDIMSSGSNDLVPRVVLERFVKK